MTVLVKLGDVSSDGLSNTGAYNLAIDDLVSLTDGGNKGYQSSTSGSDQY